MASIKYALEIADYNMARYRTLDRAFTMLFRRVLRHRFSFPTEMIYGPRDMGGAGLTRMSDTIQEGKYGCIQRMDDVRSPSYHGVSTLLHHACYWNAMQPNGEQQHTLEHNPCAKDTLWISSLLEWAAEGGAYLSRKGITENRELEKSIIEEKWKNNNIVIGRLEELGLTTLGDIVDASTKQICRLHTQRQKVK